MTELNHFAKPRPNPKREKERRVRGRVRLRGEDMTELRRQAFERSGGYCESQWCWQRITWETMELSHKDHGPRKTDTLDGVIASCKDCHREQHNPKPCARKPGREMNQTEALAYWKGIMCWCCEEEKKAESSFGPECMSKLPPQLQHDVLNATGEDYLKAMALAEQHLLAWKPEEERAS